MLDKRKSLKIVNPLLGLAFLFQLGSGFALGWTEGDWYERLERAHGFCAWALIVLLVLHLALNWTWIRANFLKTAAKPSS